MYQSDMLSSLSAAWPQHALSASRSNKALAQQPLENTPCRSLFEFGDVNANAGKAPLRDEVYARDRLGLCFMPLSAPSSTLFQHGAAGALREGGLPVPSRKSLAACANPGISRTEKL